MNTARDLMAEAERMGAAFLIESGRLRVRAPEPLPDALMMRLRAAKSDILAALETGLDWAAEDWRERFGERVAIMTIDGGATEDEAQAAAFEECVSAWLVKTPVEAGTPDRCAECGGKPAPGCVVVPFGTAKAAVWLHHTCWSNWMERRRAQAVSALAKVGIKP